MNARAAKDYLIMARKAYSMRRKRDAIFGNPDLFGEPAWDILLDLYIAQSEGKSVSVSSACIGSAAPATTGLRWLGVLADEGLVVRENDAGDQRRVLVRLTPAARAALERFFDSVDHH
ncbi:MAG: transcriptional regulator [Sphingomonadales bacterium]|nr:transcriptional regulator [Sphingomonadales bacterium]NCQ21397.1 transcriptional regulator [Sphingomonadales bacterium]NCT04184.1 transcriptional regulator [Sphingomonadales bacterium]